MVTDAQEHAPARRYRSHPPLPGITRARYPEPTSAPSSTARPRASTTLADDLDLGGSSPKGLVRQGSSPRRPGAPATPNVVAPRTDPWDGLDRWRPDSCAGADFDPSLVAPTLTSPASGGGK